ncbi:hypothetical protein MBLNU230_g3330t1 [Neophaeotheca triangularis]
MVSTVDPTGNTLPRNKRFANGHPLQDCASLQLKHETVHGPIQFLDPTRAHYDHVLSAGIPSSSDGSPETTSLDGPTITEDPGKPATNISYMWTSRNNRKGRHAMIVKPRETANTEYHTPPVTSSPREVARGIWRMLTYYPVWDVSYLVAFIFTWGSVIWVINGFLIFLPQTNPGSVTKHQEEYGGGITALIGATVFEIGSVLLMLEAVNKNHAGCLGWAIKRIPHDHSSRSTDQGLHTHHVVPDHNACTHHHANRGSLVGPTKTTGSESAIVSTEKTEDIIRSWSWMPTRDELRTKYLHDIGFIASSWQMFGATVFYISGFTSMPSIHNSLSPTSKLVLYWVPQIIGGTGFIISGTVLMIETQRH